MIEPVCNMTNSLQFQCIKNWRPFWGLLDTLIDQIHCYKNDVHLQLN